LTAYCAAVSAGQYITPFGILSTNSGFLVLNSNRHMFVVVWRVHMYCDGHLSKFWRKA